MVLSNTPRWEPADDICQLQKLLDGPGFSCPRFNHLPTYAAEVAAGNWSVDDVIGLVEQIDVGAVAEVWTVTHGPNPAPLSLNRFM